VVDSSVQAWRITRNKYASKTDAFSGKGAAENPGRWNKAGVPVVYTCSSIALCALETLVHAKSPKALNERFVVFGVRVPVELILEPKVPVDLQQRTRTQNFGDNWVKKGAHAVLKVPSIVTGEPNYLINPKHSDFSRITISDPQIFRFDPRLFPVARSIK
jgi:RES domain-containing protein